MNKRPEDQSAERAWWWRSPGAVAGEPALLLTDEPTGNLDTAAGTGVIGLLRELHLAGTTVLVITHDREIAASLPRRVAMLDGAVV
jgi:putative ABC transport system ATP-binding protein